MKLATITDWLAEAGLRSLSLDDIVDGFARRLNEVGVPVARVFAGMNTLHPMVRARSLIWDRSDRARHALRVPSCRNRRAHPPREPVRAHDMHGVTERRYDLTSPKPEHEVPLFEELRAAGMTDWLGRVFPFGELSPQIGGPADAERVGELWLVCSVTTDRPGGFADTHVAALRELLPVFALAAKATAMRAFTRGFWPPTWARIRRRVSCWARCSAARSRAWRPCCSSPTCAASPLLPTRCRAAI